MEEVKITFFKDKKITKNNPAALLEFSTGENIVVIRRHECDVSYGIHEAISKFMRKNQDLAFQELQ